MGDDGGDLRFCYAVGFGVFQMVRQGRIRDSRGHQRHNGDDAAGFQADPGIVPVFAKKNVIVEVGKIRREIAKRISARGLCDPFHAAAPLDFYFCCRSGFPLDTAVPAFCFILHFRLSA